MEEARQILKILMEHSERMAALDKVALDIAVDDPEGAAIKELVRHFVDQDTVRQILRVFHPSASFVYNNVAEVMPKIKELFGEKNS